MIRDLISLKTFVTIASQGSFAKAADKLGISRPLATKHVAALEKELGAKLFNRTTRQLSLTEAGRTLCSTASTMFGLLEGAEQDIRGATSSPKGTLRLNAPMSFGTLHLSEIVSDFLCMHPYVDVELTLDDRTINVVEEGYDIAIRVGRLEDSTLVARHLGPARMVVCASPSYLDVNGTPENPADLERHQCLVYDYLARRSTWSFERYGQTENIRVSGRLRSNNGETLVQAAVAGVGVVLAPTFIASEHLKSGTLTPLLCDWKVLEPSFYAVMPPGRIDVGKVRAFVDHLVGALGTVPYWDRDLDF
ncbi:LysR family transcriptional regulator [Rhizobium sp. SL42]|uniref:LysR family transcriptional regulator n=1 Tax=Rhizobium sp. SL42 TaxID=2806346 RepID=UPI001F1CB9F8|nr:LysR family transcriptional regulator [Rhizobium sp. SL42]UJW77596.1 LysR family transcriptional regulator [Rhizobium sp. SL42]